MDVNDTILNYFIGIRNYNMYMLGWIQGLSYIDVEEISKNDILSANVAIVSSLMLAVKEKIISNDGSLMINKKIFEDNIDIISSRVDEGYRVGDFVFSNCESLIAVLRNKLAHGNYTIDYDSCRVIIEHDNNIIKIRVNTLIKFVISCYKTYLDNKDERYILLYSDSSKRKKAIDSYDELKRKIKKFKDTKIIFKRVDNKPISERLMLKYNEVVSQYKSCGDIKVLYNFKKEYLDDNYIFDYDVESINLNNKEMEQVINIGLINSNLDYLEQMKVVGNMICNFKDPSITNIVYLIHNLIFLEGFSRNMGSAIRGLNDYFGLIYSNIFLDSCMFASISIAEFNALFSYGIDNLYKNNNLYMSNDMGMRYELLDLSLLDIQYIDYNENELNNLCAKCGKDKKLVEGERKFLDKTMNSYNKVCKSNNQKAMNNLNQIINNSTNKIASMELSIKALENDILSKKQYYNDNIDYFKNERVITGIRNSIAHNNYEIVNAYDINNCVINFRDIYQERVTFKASIRLLDFIELLESGIRLLQDFVIKNGNLYEGINRAR